MAFTGDDSWYDHLDDVFGADSEVVRVPPGVMFQKSVDGTLVMSLNDVRETDRAGRGCQMVGGPQECPLYRIQACTGGSISCTMQETTDRRDHD